MIIKIECTPTTGAVKTRKITLNATQEDIFERWALAAYPTRTEIDANGDEVVIDNNKNKAIKDAMKYLLRGFFSHIRRHRKAELSAATDATLDSEDTDIVESE